MGHHDYVFRDGVVYPEFVPTARDLRELDARAASGINATGGDVINSSKPVIIGGQGIRFLGDGTLLQGGATTVAGGRLGLGDNDFPIGPPTTRSVMVPIATAQPVPAPTTPGFTIEPSDDPIGVRVKFAPCPRFHVQIPHKSMHHGATLSSVALSFRIGQIHAAVPTMPIFAVGRVPQGHGTIDALGSASPSTPANGAAWYASGNEQIVTITCSTNNVIDVGAYTYLLAITDEAGGNALVGNIFTAMKLNYTAIPDLRFE